MIGNESRSDSAFPKARGYCKPNNVGGIDYYRSDGSGARFYQDGTFRGFLEP